MRGVVYPGGRVLPIDQECVDGGYHTDAAQAYCGRRPNRLCVFGRAGWTLPVLGRGEAINYAKQGGQAGRAGKRSEDKAYIVGTFGVKLTWYGWLRETLRVVAEEVATGVETVPYGRCHFSRDTPDDWFDQATSEHIITKTVNGYPRREWQPMPGRPNHYLDCRVYNIAAAEKLMLDTLTEQDWAAHRAERYASRDDVQGDLLAPNMAVSKPAEPSATPASNGGGDWINAQDWKL